MARKVRWVRFQISTPEGLRGAVLPASQLGSKLEAYLKQGLVVYDNVYQPHTIAPEDIVSDGESSSTVDEGDGEGRDA